MTSTEKVLNLIRQFPHFPGHDSLYVIDGEFDAGAFDRWAYDSGMSDTEYIICQFILMVWDPWHEWKIGRFYIAEAVKKLEGQNKAVILRWCNNPYFL